MYLIFSLNNEPKKEKNFDEQIEFESYMVKGYIGNNYNKSNCGKLQGISSYKWLYNYTIGCESYGCTIADSSNSGYWTQDAVGNSNKVWLVNRAGSLNNNGVDDAFDYGVRPVITLSKTVLQ